MRRNQPSLLYGIQNTDITEFVYKLHVLGGDYMRNAERNLSVLTRQGCTDYIALMSEQHIRLEDATLIYQKGMDFNQRPGGRDADLSEGHGLQPTAFHVGVPQRAGFSPSCYRREGRSRARRYSAYGLRFAAPGCGASRAFAHRHCCVG